MNDGSSGQLDSQGKIPPYNLHLPGKSNRIRVKVFFDVASSCTIYRCDDAYLGENLLRDFRNEGCGNFFFDFFFGFSIVKEKPCGYYEELNCR